MDIKVGDKVRVKRYTERPWYWNANGDMNYLMGQVVTVKSNNHGIIEIAEDTRWAFDASDFEPAPALPFEIKRIIYNDPATIILWDDGTKTVAKAHNEPFDREKGLAMAILKKMLGRGFHRFLKENCKQE
jgi:hypothetical protein